MIIGLRNARWRAGRTALTEPSKPVIVAEAVAWIEASEELLRIGLASAAEIAARLCSRQIPPRCDDWP